MDMTLKKLLAVAATGLLTASLLAGCGPSSDAKKAASAAPEKKEITIKVGSVVPAEHPMNVALKETFKKEIEEKSGGTIKVEVYDGGVLGQEKELWDSVRNGTVDVIAVGSVMWNEVPKMAMTDFPFVFRDLDHAKKVYTGEIGKEVAADVEKVGNVKFLAWHPNGVRVFSSSKPINKIGDFKGLRLRMPNNPIHIQVGQILGGNVTPMPMGEVFAALEGKVVDGQDNPLATLRTQGWYEVQCCIYESGHMIASLETMASNKLWSSLDDSQKQIVLDAAAKLQDATWDLYAKSLEEDKAFLQSKGLKFATPSDADRQKFVEMMKPVYDELNKKYDWAQDMIKRIREVQ